MASTEYDLCVIGGGAAGLVVAAAAAALGAKVVLIEKNRLGGDCLYYGCVPSKTLLHSAHLAQQMRDAGRFGLDAVAPEIDLARVMARVQEVIKGIEPNDSPERFRSLGVEVLIDQGHFVDKHTFMLVDRTIRARHFVIATGSRPRIPDLPGLANVPYHSNETIFQQTEPVKRLIILGGGPIGVEMAQAFIRLGSEVTLIARGQHLLPREDVDMASVVEEQLKADGVHISFKSEVRQISAQAGHIQMAICTDGADTQIKGTHLLLATGRQSNTEDLGLDQAGVITTPQGIEVDRRLRTRNKRIFACGDVVNQYQFTHMAEHMAGVVIRNTLFHLPAKVETRVVPWCTFTKPELARVGLSETEARQQSVAHHIYRFPVGDIDRARTDGITQGLIKIITSPRGVILGAAIVCDQAGELIHEYVLAMAKKMNLAELSSVIHIYPSLAQINRRVADQMMKEKLTPTTRKWLKRLLCLRGT